ncbi:MAG: amidohydrolase family protein, partial [Pseudomonadota bacterium]
MRVFRADLIHSPKRGRIVRMRDALITVDSEGTIDSMEPVSGPVPDHVTELRGRGVLLPGFVDCHIHAPQFPQLGMALDVPLEDWLARYTFPLEARYDDLAFATKVYEALVRRLLACGTTTAVYFATIHGPASLRLVEICLRLGQRALVGRVAMDHPEGCPDTYRDADAETAIRETSLFIDAVRALPGNSIVEPVVTPRFIPACTDDALKGLGRLAAETGTAVQTHCSESDWEHEHVMARCGISDTHALDDFGLLTRRTVLAHAGFIDDDDMNLIAARGAGVAHCPLSNAYFAGAVFPLRRALEKAVRVGLGTDISGGPSTFLLDNARAAFTASRLLESGVDSNLRADQRGVAGARVDVRDAFWLATTGGADMLDLPVGFFAPGRQMDAVLLAVPDE